MDEITQLIIETIKYFSGDAKRIQHFIKVYTFAKTIASGEDIDIRTKYCLYVASVVHDVGIKVAEEKHGKGNCGGKLQEQYGPAVAGKILAKLGFDKDITDRVCFLVGHHHTYRNVDGADWQILLEADFLVNAYEDNLKSESIVEFRDRVFRTKTGIELLNSMFGV